MVEVLKNGFYDSIQDLGRWEGISYGVPIAGAMDQHALLQANLQLQNPANAAMLEITFKGPRLQFHQPTVICVSGAEMEITINDSIPVSHLTPTSLNGGDILSFGRLQKGIRSYLAVEGGFQTQKVFGSRSWYPGITPQHRLQKGDLLPFLRCKSLKSFPSLVIQNEYLSSKILKVYPGPEFGLLSEKSKFMLQEIFHVSNQNSRMAYLMEELMPNDLPSIITAPVQPGTVQLTPSGQIIILMRDSQTTGGYPRILQLEEASINTLAQKKTGDEIRFEILS